MTQNIGLYMADSGGRLPNNTATAAAFLEGCINFRGMKQKQSLVEIAGTWDLWQYLTPSEQYTLLHSARVQALKKFHVLFDEDEEGGFLHILISGRLKIMRTEDDRRQVILYLLRDGEFIGGHLLDKPGYYGYTAETIEDSIVLLLRLDVLREIVRQNPAFCWAFSSSILGRLQKAENRMLNYRFNRTEQRVCFFLKELAEHDSRRLVTGDVEIKISLSQAFIGAMASVSRQQVTMVLLDLAKRGILRYNRQRLVIYRPDLL